MLSEEEYVRIAMIHNPGVRFYYDGLAYNLFYTKGLDRKSIEPDNNPFPWDDSMKRGAARWNSFCDAITEAENEKKLNMIKQASEL